MKVKYSIKNNHPFKTFNDSMGISLYQKSILRNKKLKYNKYTTIVFLEIIISLVFFLLMTLLTINYYCFLSILLLIASMVAVIVVLFKSLTPIVITNCFLREDEGEIEINENGIVFTLDDDVLFTLGWTHIKGLIIGKSSVNFITDYSYYFYLNKETKKEIIDAIKEYNPTLVIVK